MRNSKLAFTIASLATRLQANGMTFEEAQKASEYYLIEELFDEIPFIVTKERASYGNLSSLFVWEHTPEGHDYWSNIRTRINPDE